MAKTPKELRPKSAEPYHKQETARNMEDTMQAAWKDITERLQRMERKELQQAADMKELQDLYQTEKNANNARQAAATRQVAGTKALDRKEMPVMKDQIAKLIDVINTPKQRTPLQMQIERGSNAESKDDKAWEALTRNQTMEEEKSKKFVIGGPKFDGQSKTAHDWCAKTTSYFLNERCETRTGEEIKTCLWECLEVKVRCRAMHLERNGLAFNSFSAQEYFERVLYCFVNERTKGGAKTEYKARKQQAKEDVLEYYENKLSLFLQAYTPAERNLEQFKDAVLAGVLNTELMRGTRSRLTAVQDEWEIRNALDVELKLMRTWHLDPRNLNCSLVGLKDVYNRSEDMELMRTGQTKMEVNQMYTQEGVSEEQGWDNVNELTPTGECYFCKKPGHQRRDCRQYAPWKAKGPEKRGERRDVRKFICYNCNKEGHLARDCRSPRRQRRNPGQGNQLEAQVAAMSLQLAELLTDRKKEEVF